MKPSHSSPEVEEEPPSAVLPQAEPSSQLPGHLERLEETARDYARASASENTRRAYASGSTATKPASVATIERRLSALMWNFAQGLCG